MNQSSARARWLAALVVWSTVACLSGCDRLSERTFDEQQAGATQPNAEEPAAPEPGEEGADCSVDADCNSYLRCIEHACSVPPAVTGEFDESTPKVTIVNQAGDEVAQFYVELARTDAEQQRGLMFRREMHPDWGMLFVYDGEAQRSFWMENTFIALDMVFIDASGEVDSIVERAEPLTRVKRRSRGPARYVLELNAGTAEDMGIEPGMEIELENVDETMLPADR
jgi:hypothetical protein